MGSSPTLIIAIGRDFLISRQRTLEMVRVEVLVGRQVVQPDRFTTFYGFSGNGMTNGYCWTRRRGRLPIPSLLTLSHSASQWQPLSPSGCLRPPAAPSPSRTAGPIRCHILRRANVTEPDSRRFAALARSRRSHVDYCERLKRIDRLEISKRSKFWEFPPLESLTWSVLRGMPAPSATNQRPPTHDGDKAKQYRLLGVVRARILLTER